MVTSPSTRTRRHESSKPQRSWHRPLTPPPSPTPLPQAAPELSAVLIVISVICRAVFVRAAER